MLRPLKKDPCLVDRTRKGAALRAYSRQNKRGVARGCQGWQGWQRPYFQKRPRAESANRPHFGDNWVIGA